jgi:ketosteroid isomerase-like protein
MTEYDPSPDDPRIAGALAARQRIDEAIRAGDVETIASLFAPDLVVNNPLNRIAHRDAVEARFRNLLIAYEDFDTHFEFVGVRGELVFLMGEEVVRPTGQAPHAGKVVRRRFTDAWGEIDGAWKMVVRQATIFSIE